jgi:hypothetical protein
MAARRESRWSRVDGGECRIGAPVNWRVVVVPFGGVSQEVLGEGGLADLLLCAENGALGSLGAWSSSLGRR